MRWEIAPGVVVETTDTRTWLGIRGPTGEGPTVGLTKLQARKLRAVLSGWLADREASQRDPGPGGSAGNG